MALQTIFTAKMRNYIEKFNLLWNMHAGFVTVADAATMNFDLAAGARMQVTAALGGNRTFHWQGTDSGGVVRALGHANLASYDRLTFLVEVNQDATGSRVPVLDSSWAFSADVPTVTFSTAASKSDLLVCYYHHTSGKIRVAGFNRGF